jgi:hypothetical protein
MAKAKQTKAKAKKQTPPKFNYVRMYRWNLEQKAKLLLQIGATLTILSKADEEARMFEMKEALELLAEQVNSRGYELTDFLDFHSEGSID